MSDVTAQGSRAAIQLINAGRTDDAITMLGRQLAQRPDDVTALGLLSLAHLRSRRWADALTTADHAIALAPEYVPAWQRRCIALIELDRMDDALAAAVEYLNLAPDQWHAHYTMARALRATKGRMPDALRHANRAVELAPNDPDAHNLLGVLHRELEDKPSAERAYQAALAIDPAHALARSNLALLKLGRVGTAEVMAGLRAAAASDPQQEAIHRNMALVAVLGLVRIGTWLALVDLLITWFVVVLASGPGTALTRVVVFGLILVSWLVLLGWWIGRLRPYLRSLVPAAAARLLRSSDARWGLFGIGCSVVLGSVALLWPAAGPELVTLAYVVQIAGSLTSRQLAARRRRRIRG